MSAYAGGGTSLPGFMIPVDAPGTVAGQSGGQPPKSTVSLRVLLR